MYKIDIDKIKIISLVLLVYDTSNAHFQLSTYICNSISMKEE